MMKVKVAGQVFVFRKPTVFEAEEATSLSEQKESIRGLRRLAENCVQASQKDEWKTLVSNGGLGAATSVGGKLLSMTESLEAEFVDEGKEQP